MSVKRFPAYMHRHLDGSVHPVRERARGQDLKAFEGASAIGAEEEHACVHCGVSMSTKTSQDFIQSEATARRYPFLEEGEVSKIVDRGEQKYGFIRTSTGEELYFPGMFGRRFVRGSQHNIVLATADQQRRFGAVPLPKVGDRLLYKLSITDRGPRAEPWGYADEFDQLAAESLSSRSDAQSFALPFYPSPTEEDQSDHISSEKSSKEFRVVEQWFYPRKGKFDKPVVLWEGKNLLELERIFPSKSGYLRGAENDEYQRFVWLEVKEGKEWIQCHDLRFPQTESNTRPAP